NGSGANLIIDGDLGVEINTTNLKIDEEFVKNSQGQTEEIHIPKGNFLRLFGSIDLDVTFTDGTQAFTLSGDFAFEQITMVDPNPGDAIPAPKAIRIGAANVEVTVLGVGLIDGQGGFIFTPDGIAGK